MGLAGREGGGGDMLVSSGTREVAKPSWAGRAWGRFGWDLIAALEVKVAFQAGQG